MHSGGVAAMHIHSHDCYIVLRICHLMIMQCPFILDNFHVIKSALSEIKLSTQTLLIPVSMTYLSSFLMYAFNAINFP